MKDIFFYEVFGEEEKSLKQHLPKNTSAGFSSKALDKSTKEEPPAKIISIRTHSRVPADWSNKLSAIISRTTGIDHLTNYKFPCGYLPKYCSRAVAEQTFLLILSLLRKLPKQIENFSTFNRTGITGNEAKNKTITVVGVGNIGYEIIKLAEGMGMKTKGVDITKKYKDVEYKQIGQAIEADIIVCSMSLNEGNHNYFDYNLLKKSKGALFINISRGELVNAQDLLKLLKEGQLSGAALDVFDKESLLAKSLIEKTPNQISELSKMENVILTPHNAFNTHESVERKSQQTVQQLEKFLKEGKFIWEVKK